jgi:YHS domain-containing protein
MGSSEPESPIKSRAKPADKDLAADPVMGGYCPVTIHRRGTWVRGRYVDRAELDGLLFFTAGPAERDAFLADPALFIPALGGDCPVSLVDSGQHVRGSIFHAAQYRDRFYLMADAERKAAFAADPSRYANVDVAAGGDCVVTLAEENRRQPGFAEYAAWHAGKLYRFAGPDEKEKFLAAPEKYAEKSAREP